MVSHTVQLVLLLVTICCDYLSLHSYTCKCTQGAIIRISTRIQAQISLLLTFVHFKHQNQSDQSIYKYSLERDMNSARFENREMY